jgi:uncharacterized integral membrane protein
VRREGEAAEGEGGSDRGAGREPQRAGISPRLVLLVLLAILFVVFAAANFRTVRVSFLLFTTQARVVTVIVVAGALGFVAGYLVGRPTREQRKRLRREHDDR